MRNHKTPARDRLTPGKVPCPARCGRPRRTGDVLCVSCYRALPGRLRVELRTTRAAAMADLVDDTKWRDFMRARRVALVALR